MPVAKEKLEQILSTNFPHAKIKIIDLAGDDNHYSVEIIDKIFTGKTRIEQHKMVNKALKTILGDTLHAMQLKTSSHD
jgi:stress-induced morphogen